MRHFLSIKLCAALSLAASGVTPAVAEDETPAPHTISAELQQKIQFLNPQYLVYTPTRSSNTKLPLLIFLHGAGSVGNDIKMVSGMPTKIWNGIQKFTKGPALLVAPQCLKQDKKGERGIWTPEDLNLFLQHLKATLPVDERRI